jgi:general secretion pathway protein D
MPDSGRGPAARRWLWPLVLLASIGLALPAQSQPYTASDQSNQQRNQPLPTPPAVSATLIEALEKRGELTLQGGTLKTALFTISDQWGINIVAGELEGSVNGVFKNAPLREILDSILLSNGYGYRAVGESLVVSKLTELGQVNPFFVSATIPIAAADVSEVVQGASLLTTPNGQVRAIPSARSVVVLDFPDRVEKIKRFITAVDAATVNSRGGASVHGVRPLEVAYLKTHHVHAADMMQLLGAVLSPDGKTTVLAKEDRLLVVDYAENLRMVQEVVRRADRPRPQVVIQALIYDISLKDIEELGINWHSATNGGLAGNAVSAGGAVTGGGVMGSGTGSLVNSVTTVPFAEGAAGGTFTLYSLNNNFNMAAVAMALQNASDSRLLASPNVTVLDNELATIQSVSEIPFQQLTQTAAGGNIGTTAFKEAGITLDVTPKIGNDGTIEMQVRPEFSRLTGFTPGDNQPIIDKRVATTNVRIADGQTFVIGGLRQRSDVGDFKGIPFLKDVRVIGPLFRSRQTDIRESELMVFIRPTIIGYGPPLCDREQRTADTIDCRLNLIPQAEGCPPGYCPSCPSEGEMATPMRQVSPGLQQPEFQGPELDYAPQEALPAGEEDIRPLLPEQAASLRRLPRVQAYAAAGDAKASPERFAGGLRPGYDDRYRSSKEPTPEDQKAEQRVAEKVKEPAFWKRPFLR